MYLSLVFILLISFAGAMLESASLQNVKNYRRADMTRAVESIFAEYQKELWEVYGIFALEGSYETGSYSEELLKGTAGLLRSRWNGSENYKNSAIDRSGCKCIL